MEDFTIEKNSEFSWGYHAFGGWWQEKGHRKLNSQFQAILNLIIFVLFFLGFIGILVFPHVFLAGTLALQIALIGSQVCSGLGLLAVSIKIVNIVYEIGVKKTLRLFFWQIPSALQTKTIQSILFAIGFIGLAVLIGLSSFGIIHIPFLTVFIAQGFSLEMIEFFSGLLCDITIIATLMMLWNLMTSPIGQKADNHYLKIELPINKENYESDHGDEKKLQEDVGYIYNSYEESKEDSDENSCEWGDPVPIHLKSTKEDSDSKTSSFCPIL